MLPTFIHHLLCYRTHCSTTLETYSWKQMRILQHQQQHQQQTNTQSNLLWQIKCDLRKKYTHWFHVVAIHQWVVACAGLSTVHNSCLVQWETPGLQYSPHCSSVSPRLLMCIQSTCTLSPNLPLLVMQLPTDNLCKSGLDHSRWERGGQDVMLLLYLMHGPEYYEHLFYYIINIIRLKCSDFSVWGRFFFCMKIILKITETCNNQGFPFSHLDHTRANKSRYQCRRYMVSFHVRANSHSHKQA